MGQTQTNQKKGGLYLTSCPLFALSHVLQLDRGLGDLVLLLEEL